MARPYYRLTRLTFLDIRGHVAHRKLPPPTPTGVDWSTCASAVRDYDSSIVEAWRRGMDNRITFAALFSVVVAASLSGSYKWPQHTAFSKTALSSTPHSSQA
ncbi:hypothetical protein B0H13DRAFT_2403176 [Mycena leptocephala]|nr:hypothetical protein B0H13DRAFT_2403176 [Mycena leptocephala]